MPRDLSVLIAARNEEFLSRTVKGVLKNKQANTEVIVIADGNWPDPPLKDHPDVTLVYHPVSIGQRAAVNEAARLSNAKFIMKLDAHCILDEGFDVKLMKDCKYDWTVIPRMYNLYAFDWKCPKCGIKWYQSPIPNHCKIKNGREDNPDCDNTEGFQRIMVWKPRWNRRTDFMRFDSNLHFQYWGALGRRLESQGDIADTMSCLGACWFLHRKRYWDLDGMDEKHGSWGQMGTEVACKAWLSGGRLVVNKKTWFSHMFRTQGGTFGFPYPLSSSQVHKARKHSRDLFMGDNWPKAKHKFQWLIDKFAPIPGWPHKEAGKKGIVYYTDNKLRMKIARHVRGQIQGMELPVVSVSLKPLDLGKNIRLTLKRGYLTMFKQILAGLEASTAEIVFFCEHDVLYHPSHFDFTPPKKDVFYYNENVWKLNFKTGHALHYDCKQTSGLCAYRELLLKHYRKRVKLVEKNGYTQRMGFEPGTHNRKERVDDYKAESWKSKYPNVDIRHDNNLSPTRWKKEQFRNQRYTKDWKESDTIPGWGKGKEILS